MTESEVKTPLIFLGAGAVVPFDLPTMVELEGTFEESLVGEPTLLQSVINARSNIRTNDFVTDVESLYSLFLGKVDPYESMRDAGPFPASLSSVQPISGLKLDPKEERQQAEKILNLLQRHIIEECYIDEQQPESRRVQPLYEKLLAKVASPRDWAGCIFDIFTTNYDNSIELFGSQVGKPPFVGYEKDINNYVKFIPSLYDKVQDQIRVYKLHGSIELSLLEDKRIVASDEILSPGDSYQGKKIVSKVMVYGPEKSMIQEPYFELLSLLKRRLVACQKCLVVGYSFRDNSIRQVFADAAAVRGNSSWIELVSPIATYTASRLPYLKGSIKPVDQSIEQYLGLPEI